MRDWTQDTRNVFQRISDTMAQVGAIGKNQRNQQQNFKYRGIDDLYNGVTHAMSENGLFSVPYVVGHEEKTRTTRNGGEMVHRLVTIDYVFWGANGDCLPFPIRLIGEAMDSGDKSMNKAYAIADKYCLLQTFKVPTVDLIDPDSESHEIGSAQKPIPLSEPPVTKPVNRKLETVREKRHDPEPEPRKETAQPDKALVLSQSEHVAKHRPVETIIETTGEVVTDVQPLSDDQKRMITALVNTTGKQLGWTRQTLATQIKNVCGVDRESMTFADGEKFIAHLESLQAEVQGE